MHGRKVIQLGIFILLACNSTAQQSISYEEVNIKSYNLYEKGEWTTLLQYGKEYIAASPDFIMLRMRMGYAAFMLNNFSEALIQYDAVLKKDSYNETAHYYSFLCLKYLNQLELAGVHIKYLSKELLQKEKFTKYGVTKIGAELSYKNTQLTTRSDGFYIRLDLYTRLHPNINMYHAVALFNQTISEIKLKNITQNQSIGIKQKEYYNKTILNIGKKWQVVAAYHYLYTPFNNYIFNNNIGLLGIKYNSHYFTLQGDGIVGQVTDTTQLQYNATLSFYPKGNLNLYSISTASYSSRNAKTAVNFKQVVGAKISNVLWLEGNTTLGSFSNFLENDALYVYNAIDKNLFKAGATVYISMDSKVIFHAGYTFEQRKLYNTITTFNQHSITGGLTCKF